MTKKTIRSLFVSGIFLSGLMQSTAYGMDPEEFDVVIVGGGLSGLSCARDLSKTNPELKVAIVEGRDRLGGRTWTQNIGGQLVEKGGEFLDPESDHPAMHKLVKEMKLGLIPFKLNGSVFAVKDEKQVELKAIKHIMDRVIDKLKACKLSLTNQDLLNPVDNKWVLSSLLSKVELDEEEKALLTCIIRDEEGIDLDRAPLNGISGLIERLSDYNKLISVKSIPLLGKALLSLSTVHYRIEGGTNALVERLKASLGRNVSVLESCPVQYITKIDDLYCLSVENSKQLRAKKVVVSMPFSTLRSESKVLDDDALQLPAVVRETIDSMAYGTNSKIIFPQEAPSSITYGLNLDQQYTFWGTPVGLTCMVGGAPGAELNNESEVLQSACALAGRKESFEIVNWSQNRFSKGSYRAFTAGMSPMINVPSLILPGMCEFSNPLNENSFYFIGEHTCLEGGYMNSAVHSGRTVAEHLAKTLKEASKK